MTEKKTTAMKNPDSEQIFSELSCSSIEQFRSAKLRALGKLIREYRLSAPMDYAELARLSEIDEISLREIEQGILNPSLSRLYAICNVLNIPPSKVESLFLPLPETSVKSK